MRDESETGPLPEPEGYLWPLVAMILVILAQVLVPARLRVGPPLIVPIIETLAVIVLIGLAAKPGPLPNSARPLVLSLFGLLAVANTLAAARLVSLVLGDSSAAEVSARNVNRLLVAAVLALATNIVTFSLLYWQIDGGGPRGRVVKAASYPDFQFPQTSEEELAPPQWRPRFPDYLYVAFTNVVAFSPTDTLPLTIRAKGLMALQSMIALGVLVVVLSRVINVLPA